MYLTNWSRQKSVDLQQNLITRLLICLPLTSIKVELPIDRWNSTTMQFQTLYSFGCVAVAHIPDNFFKNKFHPSGIFCAYIGSSPDSLGHHLYSSPNSLGHHLYSPEVNTIFKSVQVKFYTDVFYFHNFATKSLSLPYICDYTQLNEITQIDSSLLKYKEVRIIKHALLEV